MDTKQQVKPKGKKKSLWAKMIDTLDKKMEEKAKKTSCCSSSNKSKGGSCC